MTSRKRKRRSSLTVAYASGSSGHNAHYLRVSRGFNPAARQEDFSMPSRALFVLLALVHLAHAPAVRGAWRPTSCSSCPTTTARATSAATATRTSRRRTSTPSRRRACGSTGTTSARPQCVPSRATIMTGRSAGRRAEHAVLRPAAAEYKVVPGDSSRRRPGTSPASPGGPTTSTAARLPPESQKVFDEHGLKTFPKRLDFVKTAGQRRRRSSPSSASSSTRSRRASRSCCNSASATRTGR